MFMKSKVAIASTVLAAALASTSAHAATANADATATILEQVTVTKSADLDFGTIVVGATGGTVDISTAGARTCAAALVCSGAVTAAAFDVDGTTGEVVDVTVPANVTLTSGTGPTATSMTATLSGSDATITLDGTDAFTVGGSLAVGANQAAGDYSGTFTVTVDYQ